MLARRTKKTKIESMAGPNTARPVLHGICTPSTPPPRPRLTVVFKDQSQNTPNLYKSPAARSSYGRSSTAGRRCDARSCGGAPSKSKGGGTGTACRYVGGARGGGEEKEGYKT